MRSSSRVGVLATLVYVASALLGEGCASTYVPYSTPVAAPRDTVAASVYKAVVSEVFKGAPPATIYVQSTTEVYVARPNPLRSFPADVEAPPELLERLWAISRVPRSADSLSLPTGSRGLHDAKLVNPEAREELPPRSFAFSPVAVSRDGKQALLHYEFHCGGLCGYGYLTWLERSSDGRWRYRATWHLVSM